MEDVETASAGRNVLDEVRMEMMMSKDDGKDDGIND